MGPGHPLEIEQVRRRMGQFQAGGGYGSRPGEIPGLRPAALGGTGYAGYSGDANQYRGISGGGIQDYLRQSTPGTNQAFTHSPEQLAQRMGEFKATQRELTPEAIAKFSAPLGSNPFKGGAGSALAMTQPRGTALARSMPATASPMKPGGLLAQSPPPVPTVQKPEPDWSPTGYMARHGLAGQSKPGDLLRDSQSLPPYLGGLEVTGPEEGKAGPFLYEQPKLGRFGLNANAPQPRLAQVARPPLGVPQPPAAAQPPAAGQPPDRNAMIEQHARYLEAKGYPREANEYRLKAQDQEMQNKLAGAQTRKFEQEADFDKQLMDEWGPEAFMLAKRPDTTPDQLDAARERHKARMLAGGAAAPMPPAAPGAPAQQPNAFQAGEQLPGLMPGYRGFGKPADKGGTPMDALSTALNSYPGLMEDPRRGPAYRAHLLSQYGRQAFESDTQAPWTFPLGGLFPQGLFPESEIHSKMRRFLSESLRGGQLQTPRVVMPRQPAAPPSPAADPIGAAIRARGAVPSWRWPG